MQSWLPAGLFASACGAALALPACDGSGSTALASAEHARIRPNVILISLDTLRADRLGCYGYARPTSPSLDRFASVATRFERAFTPQGFTLTAHMSLLTGLYPSVHRVDEHHALPANAPTLAEALKRLGHATAAVVEDMPWMDRRYGLDRGFERWMTHSGSAPGKNARLEGCLSELGGGPFFLFAHYFDAHSDMGRVPYESAVDDALAFAGPEGAARDVCSPRGLCGTQFLIEIQETGVLPDETVRRLVSDEYDAGVRSLDRDLGLFLAKLEEAGRFEDSIILVTADHGEMLFEHGQVLHGHIWDEVLRVPLLLHLPGQQGGRVARELVSLVDILPTVLELCGTAAGPLCQGTSFANALRGLPCSPRPPVEIATDGIAFGLRDEAWKFFGIGEFHLYDLEHDAREEHNVWDETDFSGPGRAMRLALREHRLGIARLRDHIGPPPSLEALGEAERAGLRGLGYGGGKRED